jgi:hypothetical protein
MYRPAFAVYITLNIISPCLVAPNHHPMFNRVRPAVARLVERLMQPVRAVKNTKQRLLFRALRSRFFLLVAVLSAMPILFGSFIATYKAAHNPLAGTSLLLLWATATSSWFLFLLTVGHQHWRMQQRKRNGQSDV